MNNQPNKRYCKLNSKKLKDIPKELNCIFPYSTCKSYEGLSAANTVKVFKRMSKKYRFCYKNIDYAIINNEINTSIPYKQYVFTNIILEDEFPIYDMNERYYIRQDKDNDYVLNGYIDIILKSMRKKEGLKTYLEKLSVFPNESKFSNYNEFIWRLRLIHTNIYKSNILNDSNVLSTEYEKHLIQRKYLMIFKTNLKTKLNYQEILKGMKKTKNNIKYLKGYITYKIQGVEGIYDISDLQEYIHKEIRQLGSTFEEYDFLYKPYSYEYKRLFNSLRTFLSKWKTQEAIRSLKEDIKSQFLDCYKDDQLPIQEIQVLLEPLIEEEQERILKSITDYTLDDIEVIYQERQKFQQVEEIPF